MITSSASVIVIDRAKTCSSMWKGGGDLGTLRGCPGQLRSERFEADACFDLASFVDVYLEPRGCNGMSTKDEPSSFSREPVVLDSFSRDAAALSGWEYLVDIGILSDCVEAMSWSSFDLVKVKVLFVYIPRLQPSQSVT